MAWGGGGGWAGGPSASQAASSAGLPFAGIAPDQAEKIKRVLGDEPEHEPPVVHFSASTWDRRPITMRRLLEGSRRSVVLIGLLIVLETVTSRLGPTLTQQAIDRGMGLASLGNGPLQGDKGFLVGIVVAYLALVVVSILVGAARIRLAGQVGEGILYDLRVRVFSQFQRLSLDFFTGEKSGRLMTRMTSDIENLQQLFQEGLVQFAVQGLTLVVLTVQMLAFSPRLAFISLVVVVPLMLALTIWFQRASDRGYLAVRDRIADVLSDLSEGLAGIRLVTAHNRQRQNAVHHTNVVGDYRRANDYTARVSAIYGPGTEALGTLASLLVLGIGGKMVLDGQMDVGELTGFMLALTYFFAPISQLAQLYNTYQQGNAGMVKLRELMAIEPSVPEAPGATELPPIEGRITLEHVTFGYDPTNPVLHDVSLEVPAGATWSLVGATGAGKSTIAKLVTRFYDPTQGRVCIDGIDLRTVTLTSLRRQLGVVPQEPFLFHGTLRDNLAFARPDATDAELMAAVDVVGLDDLVGRLPEGLDTPVHERGSSLSSGERQLLALARAFVARPRVLVLDEATSSLDLQTEEKVERALDVILEGRTALIIAHRLATAMRADTIVVVGDGGILELGSHDELVARGGVYAGMYAVWEAHTHLGA